MWINFWNSTWNFSNGTRHIKWVNKCTHLQYIYIVKPIQYLRYLTPFLNCYCLVCFEIPLAVAQRLKCLPAMRETWVRSLGWEDPLEESMATYSSILAWRIPWREEPGGLESRGLQRVGHNWATSLHFTSLSQKKKRTNILMRGKKNAISKDG